MNQTNIDDLIKVRETYSKNPILGYLNINSLRNKITNLREVVDKVPIDILCIDETKLDESFPDSQFSIDNYQYPPYRRDRNSKGGGKIVYVRQGLISKRLKSLESKLIETICIELTISKKKWCSLFAYRPPNFDKRSFFEEISNSLCLMVSKYENILLVGDFNINLLDSKSDNRNHFSDLRDTFALTNLVKDKTCFKSNNGTLLDVILTNRPNSFQKTVITETGLSDCHKLISTVFRSTFVKLPPKTIRYRSYKNFNKQNFVHELDQRLIRGDIYKTDDSYSKLTEIISEVLEKHAPMKVKTIRGNQAPFMNKKLSKVIMNKSRIKNNYLKWPSRENFLAYKNIKNKCNNLLKKSKKVYFQENASEGSTSTKKFWSTVKPFVSSKGTLSNDNIIIEASNDSTVNIKGGESVHVKTKDEIRDEQVLVEMFNNHYINIVEKSSGLAPKSIGNSSDPDQDQYTVQKIIKLYQNHPSIKKIKENFKNTITFDFPKPTVKDISCIIKSLDPKKATGPDGIPIKVIKYASNVIDSHLCNIIIKDLELNKYSEELKTALVRPIFKKNEREKIENYRPVSILNGMSKVYERFIHNCISSYAESILSDFISAYRKNYSSNHVLLRLIENWKKSLDNKNFVGTVLMDLSKAFDCIPHDLLVAKLHAYGLSEEAVTFLYSYLKRRKQGVKINDTESIFQILLSGVPQGSILGPILFNLFINDLFLFIDEVELANFADDNTIYTARKSVEELIKILEKESKTAIDWFKMNDMIVNPEKFQAMILSSDKKENKYDLNINNSLIPSETSVTLLGIQIDNKLNFAKHISANCRKASNQLNAISRIQNYLGKKEKKILINSFVYSNFNYCPLTWHFCSKSSQKKIEKIQYRCLKMLTNDYCSDYKDLLQLTGNPTMEIRRIRTLVVEIFKTLNNINPNFMKEIFHFSPYNTHKRHNIFVHSRNTSSYGDESLRALGPHIWNSLPESIKSTTSLFVLKKFIKNWFGPKCKCKLCL